MVTRWFQPGFEFKTLQSMNVILFIYSEMLLYKDNEIQMIIQTSKLTPCSEAN
jgi:hypothetical protein